MSDYDDGHRAGRREIAEDAWTADLAQRYLDQVGEPCGEFDRGHQAAIRERAEERA